MGAQQKGTRLRPLGIVIITIVHAASLCLPLSAPLMVRAQEATEPVVCVTPQNIAYPTGSSAHTYTWNCETQLWENPYFTWSPVSKVASPRYAPEHRFNATSNLWEIWQWEYVASRGRYDFRVVSTYAPIPPPTQTAAIENTGPDSTNTIDDSNGSISNTGPNSNNSIEGDSGSGSIDTTGPDSDNTIVLDSNGQTNYNLDIDLNLDNNLDSTAVSGNASVLQNTLGGNATTGDALAMANIINMLQSTWGWGGGLPELYTANIQGDYFGDIMIDPSLLAGGVSTNGCGCNDLTVNASTDSTITNDVNLLAESGDAAVSGNTSAGNATSGDATALANLVNMISSSITSGSSFLGVLNIHGNLNGDVLVAQDVIDELLAANIPTAQLSLCGCGDVLADFTDTQSITNNINTNASSGNATVANNTSAGNATSGNAQTSLTVFNVTGRQVVGENALLVFVNVLGEWVGFLVDAPVGSTAAMYGGDITQNTAFVPGGDSEYNIDTNVTINNNVNVAAHSGNADVSRNTTAGNATSGDADAAANISNIVNSTFSLAGWFGLLFINILGDWFGSFGTDTAYGDLPAMPAVNNSVSPSSPSAHITTPMQNATNRVFRPGVRVFRANFSEDGNGNTVLANATETTPSAPAASKSFAGSPSSTGLSPTTIGLLLLVGASFLVIFYGDRVGALFRRR